MDLREIVSALATAWGARSDGGEVETPPNTGGGLQPFRPQPGNFYTHPAYPGFNVMPEFGQGVGEGLYLSADGTAWTISDNEYFVPASRIRTGMWTSFRDARGQTLPFVAARDPRDGTIALAWR